MRREPWRSDGLIAWTERDGPGRSPAGPSRVVTTGLAIGLAAVFTGILSVDTLCPEHRAWVQILATAALIGTVIAAIGLVKQWAIAPVLALVVTLCGVAIGLLDAIHSAGRGRTIAAAFGILALGAAVVVWRQIALMRWDKSVRRSIASEPVVATLAEPAAESIEETAEPAVSKADHTG
jgi:uncharacterized membrane protein YccC